MSVRCSSISISSRCGTQCLHFSQTPVAIGTCDHPVEAQPTERRQRARRTTHRTRNTEQTRSANRARASRENRGNKAKGSDHIRDTPTTTSSQSSAINFECTYVHTGMVWYDTIPDVHDLRMYCPGCKRFTYVKYMRFMYEYTDDLLVVTCGQELCGLNSVAASSFACITITANDLVCVCLPSLACHAYAGRTV